MTTTRHSVRAKRRSGSNRAPIGVIAAAIVLIAAVAGVLVAASAGGSTGTADGSGTDAVALAPTGEVNAMGLPVYETPGYASGTASAGGVTVQGSDWEMGHVPLDIAVRPFWTITNTGSARVTLGEPRAQVREGCCPGPLVLGTSTLAPGESTVLTFELSMHEGMDGWHDMGVYVPILGAGDRVLELNVTGDFRN